MCCLYNCSFMTSQAFEEANTPAVHTSVEKVIKKI